MSDASITVRSRVFTQNGNLNSNTTTWQTLTSTISKVFFGRPVLVMLTGTMEIYCSAGVGGGEVRVILDGNTGAPVFTVPVYVNSTDVNRILVPVSYCTVLNPSAGSHSFYAEHHRMSGTGTADTIFIGQLIVQEL